MFDSKSSSLCIINVRKTCIKNVRQKTQNYARFVSPPARKKNRRRRLRIFRAIRVKLLTARKWHEDEIHTLRIVKGIRHHIYTMYLYKNRLIYLFRARGQGGFSSLSPLKYPPLKTSSRTWQQIFLKGREREGERREKREKRNARKVI